MPEEKQTQSVKPSRTPLVTKKGMSTGAKVGIGVGISCFIIVIIIGVIGFFAFKKIFTPKNKNMTRLVYECDLSKIPENEKNDVMAATKNVIKYRVEGYGISSPSIQTDYHGNNGTITVELPGVTNINKANDANSVISKVAKLEFKEPEGEVPKYPNGEPNFQSIQWKPTGLTGAQFKKAQVEFDKKTGDPEIKIEFNDEGTKLFGEVTKRNIGNPIAIFLDNQLISAPTVQAAITDGNGNITGKFNVDEAKKLVIQLNSGSLPIQLKLVTETIY